MKHLCLASCLALSLSAGSALAATFDDPFTSFVAFGDSFADDGKFGALFPPSFDGRFSNGPTYAELIGEDFEADGKIALNFALGGATAEDDNENDFGAFAAAAAPFATFTAQIQSFAFAAAGLPLGDNPLFSVLIGANDILQDIGESPTIGADAADAVKAGIEAIGALSTDFRTFVVANLGDPALSPRFAGKPEAVFATAVTDQFNAQLEFNAQMLRDDGFEIIEFDLNALVTDLFNNASALGIGETGVSCAESLLVFDPFNNCAFNPLTGVTDITLADNFFFVDDVHPNRIVQAEVASAFRATVAPIPLPAGGLLLLAGLSAFGALRARR